MEGFGVESVLSSAGKWLVERLHDIQPGHELLGSSHQMVTSSDLPVERVSVDGGSAQGGEEIILAARGFSPALSPEQWPGNAAENPREYLQYLLEKAERDQRALEDWYAEVLKRQPVVWTESGPIVADTGAKEAVQDLIDLKRDIEAARKGVFPPSQEKLTELYNRLMSIRGGANA